MTKISKLLAVSCLAWPLVAYAGEGHEWGYTGKQGPEYWGRLAQEFDMCRRGRNQSPVDLVADIDADLPELKFAYEDPRVRIEVNTGHAIREDVNPGNYLWMRQDRFELKQFHFHSPSEHLVKGKAYPMEVHLVHQNEQGAYAVVGLFVEEGGNNDIMDQLPLFRVKRGEDPDGDPVDFNALIPNRKDYFYYNGSLTTPPCSEGVTWIVLKQPVVASRGQIDHLHDLLGFDNSRPVQPLNSRLVLD